VTNDNIINAQRVQAAAVAITGHSRPAMQKRNRHLLSINKVILHRHPVAADKTYSINVPGSALLNDADKVIDAKVTATDTAGKQRHRTATQPIRPIPLRAQPSLSMQ